MFLGSVVRRVRRADNLTGLHCLLQGQLYLLPERGCAVHIVTPAPEGLEHIVGCAYQLFS
jgi:hypothetical protein